MTRRKSSRELTKVNIRLFTDQIEDIKEFFPGEINETIRLLLDKSLKQVKIARLNAEKDAANVTGFTGTL